MRPSADGGKAVPADFDEPEQTPHEPYANCRSAIDGMALRIIHNKTQSFLIAMLRKLTGSLWPAKPK